MKTLTRQLRYHLPKKALKGDCPECGSKHRRTLSRYVDSRTGDPLPEQYGRCDRESNCGYQLSPYTKGPSGLSYADEVYEQSKFDKPPVAARSEKPVRRPTNQPIPAKVYTIPDEVFTASLGHHERNQFAQLLVREFGPIKADELLQRFQVGTSAHWPGSCVFWLKDKQQRIRAGQVVLFADDWHKAKYIDKEDNSKACISSVSHSLIRRYKQQQQPAPEWLTDYDQNAPRWPILFGLHQLAAAPVDQPVALVEAPKTAVVCSALIPDFVWLAVGALSYLNADRLAPLRDRAVMLFPDLSKDGKAFIQWSRVAHEMNATGYQIQVSDLLEQRATDEQRIKGLDLADFLLTPEIMRPRWIIDGRTIYGEVLEPKTVELQPGKSEEPTLRPFTPPTTRIAHSKAPLSFDAAEQLRAVKWCVLPIDAIE